MSDEQPSLSFRLIASAKHAGHSGDKDLMIESANEIRKMRAALEEIHNMYSHAWDLTDGGLMMMSGSVPKFEAAHKAVRDALGIKWLEETDSKT